MVLRDGPALYAPAQAVTRFLDAFRRGEVEGRIDLQALRDVGTPDSVAARALHALENLELVDSSGEPSVDLRSFGSAATDDDAREVLGTVLRRAYRDIFESVPDLTRASVDELERAFSIFDPESQRPRMIRLFFGLCRYAGIVERTAPRRRTPAAEKSGATTAGRRPFTPSSLSHETQAVELLSGGTVSLTVPVRLFDLVPDDRAFVLDLVDRLRTYGQAAGSPSPTGKRA